ncbi:MAG: kelch repeat-containing protein [Archangium sp.]
MRELLAVTLLAVTSCTPQMRRAPDAGVAEEPDAGRNAADSGSPDTDAGMDAGGEGGIDAGAWDAGLIPDSWRPTAPLDLRLSHVAALLDDGRVLIAGGSVLRDSWLYDPQADRWIDGGEMATFRDSATATRLPDGRVLVTGGWDGLAATSTTDLFDPITNTWSAGPPMASARFDHSATALRDGRVLVVAGTNNSTAELYDPTTNRWTPAGTINAGQFHTATLLQDGRVLITGGRNAAADTYFSTVNLFDPVTGQWQAASSLMVARYGHQATLLPNGRVLITGGFQTSGYVLTTELYDPGSNTWMIRAMQIREHSAATAVKLGSRVLLMGGFNGSPSDTNSVEEYDFTTNRWSEGRWMLGYHHFHTATVMQTGQILIVGQGSEIYSAGRASIGFLSSRSDAPAGQELRSVVFILNSGAARADALAFSVSPSPAIGCSSSGCRDSANTCGDSLDAGAGCELQISCHPPTVGHWSATLEVVFFNGGVNTRSLLSLSCDGT